MKCKNFITDKFGCEYGLCSEDGQRYCSDIGDCYYKQLQLKDKMIELMAEEISKYNTDYTYFNNKHEEVSAIQFYKYLAEQ